jgi:Zinc finger, C3HC4 type (RING finger)
MGQSESVATDRTTRGEQQLIEENDSDDVVDLHIDYEDQDSNNNDQDNFDQVGCLQTLSVGASNVYTSTMHTIGNPLRTVASIITGDPYQENFFFFDDSQNIVDSEQGDESDESGGENENNDNMSAVSSEDEFPSPAFALNGRRMARIHKKKPLRCAVNIVKDSVHLVQSSNGARYRLKFRYDADVDMRVRVFLPSSSSTRSAIEESALLRAGFGCEFVSERDMDIGGVFGEQAGDARQPLDADTERDYWPLVIRVERAVGDDDDDDSHGNNSAAVSESPIEWYSLHASLALVKQIAVVVRDDDDDDEEAEDDDDDEEEGEREREREHSRHSDSDAQDNMVFDAIVGECHIGIGKRLFVLHDIYGVPLHAGEPPSSKDCVVCLSDEPTTLALPCRHISLCPACADLFRQQSNKCPICRGAIRALLCVKS